MEWVLQLADECDDAIAAWRQWWLRAAPEMELILVGCWGLVVFAATSVAGVKTVSLAAGAILLSALLAVSVQRSFTGYTTR